MIDYTGSRCPACNKKFSDGDDIVVCPVCGAPHHRECYSKSGHCTFENEHITGKAWSPTKPLSTTPSQQPARIPPPNHLGLTNNPFQRRNDSSESGGQDSFGQTPKDNQESDSQRVCSSCGSRNPSTNLFCNLCGNWLGEGQSQGQSQGQNQGQNPRDRAGGPNISFGGLGDSPFSQLGQQIQFDPKYALYGGLSPEEKIEDNTVHDIATYVGKSSSYYAPRFKAISETSQGFSVNLAAFLFHGFYFLYRKMYAIGVILLAIFIVSTLPAVMYTKEALLYDSYRLEVGVDEQGKPVIPYEEAAMARLERYQIISSRTRMAFLAISAITSLLANRLYYDHSMKKIKNTLKVYQDTDRKQGKCIECENALSSAGGVSVTAVVVSIVVLALVATAYLAYELFLK